MYVRRHHLPVICGTRFLDRRQGKYSKDLRAIPTIDPTMNLPSHLSQCPFFFNSSFKTMAISGADIAAMQQEKSGLIMHHFRELIKINSENLLRLRK
ncbi:hypothetical protein [Herbaspirillum robiniae]|uniref:hypothetical protein n=1 Tax=Herbaspirillum robiniae TaxID=2014887 RepID=UPI003D77A74E